MPESVPQRYANLFGQLDPGPAVPAFGLQRLTAVAPGGVKLPLEIRDRCGAVNVDARHAGEPQLESQYLLILDAA